MSEAPILSRQVDISTIGTAKAIKKFEATEVERVQLAASLGIVDIPELSAEIALNRDQKGIIYLDGRLSAEVVQNCVVSLVPVTQAIDEEISLRLVQGDSRQASTPAKSDAEINVDPMQEDPPEIVTGRSIDLGSIVIEHLVLAIDPYPRAPGALAPDNPVADSPESRDSPFSVLEKLRGPRSDET